MNILIVHLSDLHIGNDIDLYQPFFSNLFSLTKNQADACDLVLLIITGDIADKGLDDGYINAELLLQELLRKYNLLKNKRVELIIVPGNHDCQITKEKTARERIIRDIVRNDDGSEIIDSETIDILTQPQNRFFDFIKEFDSMSGAFDENKIIWKKILNIDNSHISINCINSAWMTTNPENQGKLVLPEIILTENMQQNSGLALSIMHHPLSWFKPWNSKRLRDYLENCSNIIFTGHEHWQELSIRSNEKSQITYYSDGDTIAKSKIGINLAITYNITQNELNNFELERILYDLTNNKKLDNTDLDNQINTLIPRSHDQYLKITKSIKNYISDIGANIRHPEIDKIKLDDIFVYPDFQLLNPDPLKKVSYESSTVSSENSILFNKGELSKYIVLGQSRSGRTTFLKKLYSTLLHDGYMPIWIDGHKIRSTSTKDINALISKEGSNQYSDFDTKSIEVFDNSKKIIIIDDFDQSKLQRRYRRKFMDNFKEIYPNIVVTSHDLLEIEEMTGNEPDASIIYDGFKVFQVKEFGNFRRSQLIKKWFSLNNDPYTDFNEQLRKLDNVTHTINTIIGKNLTPSHPLVILVLLQNITSIEPSNFNQSSYGYYYQTLIVDSLKKINSKPEAINAFSAFLSSIAYFMFTNECKKINDVDFRKFCIDHAEKHDIQNKIDNIIEEILLSEVLTNNDGNYFFSYKYMFFFFVAQYFSDNISKPQIREKISMMALKPHSDTNSNILMFLSYLSKDRIIIDSLLSAASRVFCDEKAVRFDSDIQPLNDLYNELPKLVLKFIDVEEARDEHLKEKDNIEESQTESESFDECEDFDSSLNLVDKITVSFKLAEIIGQIVKNSYASLEGDDKINMVENTFQLILKPLGVLLRLIMENPENIAIEISKILQNQPLYDSEDREIVKSFAIAHLTRVCSIFSYTFISRISQFVGSEDLLVTYERLLKGNDSNSYRLIDAVIKVDHFSSFPIAELRKLNKEFEHNPLAITVIAQSVRKYLYMFEIGDIRYKQQICQEFGIQMSEMRRIEHISKDKKGER